MTAGRATRSPAVASSGANSAIGIRVRSLVARWLHRWRHARAKRRLRRLTRSTRIVVICHGNICRSPYLAGALQRLLPTAQVSSAGMIMPNQSAPEHARTAASRRAVDLSAHRSRLITREIIEATDLVITMDAQQAGYLIRNLAAPAERMFVAGDFDPDASEGRTIRDPLRQSLDVFEACYSRLDRCAGVIAAVVRAEVASSPP